MIQYDAEKSRQIEIIYDESSSQTLKQQLWLFQVDARFRWRNKYIRWTKYFSRWSFRFALWNPEKPRKCHLSELVIEITNNRQLNEQKITLYNFSPVRSGEKSVSRCSREDGRPWAAGCLGEARPGHHGDAHRHHHEASAASSRRLYRQHRRRGWHDPGRFGAEGRRRKVTGRDGDVGVAKDAGQLYGRFDGESSSSGQWPADGFLQVWHRRGQVTPTALLRRQHDLPHLSAASWQQTPRQAPHQGEEAPSSSHYAPSASQSSCGKLSLSYAREQRGNDDDDVIVVVIVVIACQEILWVIV